MHPGFFYVHFWEREKVARTGRKANIVLIFPTLYRSFIIRLFVN